MNKSESIKELATALAKFQAEVQNPANTKRVSTGSFSYNYAPLNEILSQVRPLLSKHGLSIVQAPTTSENNILVSTMLLHNSGEWIELDPVALKMDKITAQGAGSAITYARRYSLSAVLGISSEDDDDGNHAEPKEQKESNKQNKVSLTDSQIKRLYAIANKAGYNSDTVKTHVKNRFNKEVKELTKEEYDTVCNGYEGLKE